MFSVTGNLNLLSQFQELSASTLRYHTVKEPMDATRFKRNQLIFFSYRNAECQPPHLGPIYTPNSQTSSPLVQLALTVNTVFHELITPFRGQLLPNTRRLSCFIGTLAGWRNEPGVFKGAGKADDFTAVGKVPEIPIIPVKTAEIFDSACHFPAQPAAGNMDRFRPDVSNLHIQRNTCKRGRMQTHVCICNHEHSHTCIMHTYMHIHFGLTHTDTHKKRINDDITPLQIVSIITQMHTDPRIVLLQPSQRSILDSTLPC